MAIVLQKAAVKGVLGLAYALPRDSAHDLRPGLEVQSYRTSRSLLATCILYITISYKHILIATYRSL